MPNLENFYKVRYKAAMEEIKRLEQENEKLKIANEELIGCLIDVEDAANHALKKYKLEADRD